MIRNTIVTASLAAGLALTVSAPAHATWGCYWGKKCNTSTSGGTTTTSGGTTTTSGGMTTSGGTTTTTSGGTKVPEPGMLGLMGAGLVGVAVVRRKARRNKK